MRGAWYVVRGGLSTLGHGTSTSTDEPVYSYSYEGKQQQHNFGSSHPVRCTLVPYLVPRTGQASSAALVARRSFLLTVVSSPIPLRPDSPTSFSLAISRLFHSRVTPTLSNQPSLSLSLFLLHRRLRPLSPSKLSRPPQTWHLATRRSTVSPVTLRRLLWRAAQQSTRDTSVHPLTWVSWSSS